MTNINWLELPEANEDSKRSAEMLIRTADGVERRTDYDGGWLNIVDATHTQASPQTVTAGVSTALTIDGLGAATETNYRRGVSTEVWDGNVFKPAAVGECYMVRVTMNVAKATSNATTLELDLGIGADFATQIVSDVRPLTKGQDVVDKINFVFPIFCLDAFGLQGGQFTLLASQSITVWAKAIFIQRTFTP